MFPRLLKTTRAAAASLRTQHSYSTRSSATIFSHSSSLTTKRVSRPVFAAHNNLRSKYFSAEAATEELALPPAAGEAAPLDPAVEKVVDEVMKLNILQISQLTKELKERLGLPDVPMGMPMGGMPMMAASPGGDAGGAAAEPVVEKTEFDVKLTGYDDKSKIKVIKEVRALTGLGLKEAKAAVEAVPNVLTEGLKKEEADEWVEKLKAVGGQVELE